MYYYFTAAVRLWVPREDSEQFIARPFDLVASDVDVLLELKPEGKVCLHQRLVPTRSADAHPSRTRLLSLSGLWISMCMTRVLRGETVSSL